MRYVIVPPDVQIVVKKTGEPVMQIAPGAAKETGKPLIMSHSDFVIHNVSFHPDFSKGGADGLRRKKRLESDFLDCKPGDILGVEEADFKLARTLLDAIVWNAGFAPFADQMLPHFEAWETAEKQDGDWKKKYDAEQAAKKNGVADIIEAAPRPA